MTNRTLIALMSDKTDEFEQIADVVENDKYFDFPIDFQVWDNEICVPEGSTPLTDEEINALNLSFKIKLCTLILEKNFENSPINPEGREFRMLLKRRFDEITPLYNQLFVIQNQKFKTLWFHDYDLYRDADSATTLGSSSQTIAGGSTTEHSESTAGTDADATGESLAGTSPNVVGEDAYADAMEQSTSLSHSDTETETDGSSSFTSDSTTTNSGTDSAVEHSHEYRIGATGQTPHDLIKKAYENCHNIVNDFASEFDDCFYFDWSINKKCW